MRLRRRFLPWVVLAVGALALIAILPGPPIEEHVYHIASRASSFGALGAFAYSAIYIGAALLFTPGAILSIGAGLFFGPVAGVAIASLSSTAAAAIAFLLARRFGRKRLAARLHRDLRFRAIDRVIGEHSWRLVALLRLSPIVPYNLSNYLYGVTAVRFVPYVLATLLAKLPATVVYVLIGHLGGPGGARGGGEPSWRPIVEWTFLAVGVIATVITTVYATRIVRAQMAEAEERETA